VHGPQKRDVPPERSGTTRRRRPLLRTNGLNSHRPWSLVFEVNRRVCRRESAHAVQQATVGSRPDEGGASNATKDVRDRIRPGKAPPAERRGGSAPRRDTRRGSWGPQGLTHEGASEAFDRSGSPNPRSPPSAPPRERWGSRGAVSRVTDVPRCCRRCASRAVRSGP